MFGKGGKCPYICNAFLERALRPPKRPFLFLDSVAQSVEHLTFNQRVLGSNPSGITRA